MRRVLGSVVVCGALLVGCGGGDKGAGAGDPLAALGGGTHDLANVNVTEIATSADFLDEPRDLAFNPEKTSELWVVNMGNSSVTVLSKAGTSGQEGERYKGPASTHFLAKPAALAFGVEGTFATIHDEDQPTQGEATPADFMGPTLWTSNLDDFDGGDEGHVDMLHNSPLGVGIAWGGTEDQHLYWVFDGFHGAISRYDFGQPHSLGGTNHGDGEIVRYAEGEVAYVAGVASHVEFEQATGLLYIADTGNGRIAVLDTATGSPGSSIAPNYDGVDQFAMTGATLTTFVAAGGEAALQQPSGLVLHEDMLFVSDNATSRILAFDLDGTLLDYVDTGLPAGSLQGLAIRGGSVYAVDTPGNSVIRYEAK